MYYLIVLNSLLRLTLTLCLEQSYGCLFQPLYPCICPNLQVTYSDVFIELLGAHTLLGTVMQLFSPASVYSVHLYTDKPAGVLLWTNLGVVWEYLDQWEQSNITRLICVDQSQVLEFTEIDRQTNRENPAIQLLGPTYTLYKVGQRYAKFLPWI